MTEQLAVVHIDLGLRDRSKADCIAVAKTNPMAQHRTLPGVIDRAALARHRSWQWDHAKTGKFAATGRGSLYNPAIFARCATSASTASSAGVGICVRRPIS